MKLNKDIIVVNAPYRDYKGIGDRAYDEPVTLFKEQCMQMTVLGATIIKSTLIMKVIEKIPLQKRKNYGMWQPIAFFEYFADKKIKAVSVVDDIWIGNPCAVSKSFWTTTTTQWIELWTEMIKELPNCYDKYKKEVLKVQMSDFHPFYVINLLRIRAYGGLTFKDVCKYQKQIPLVTDTSVTKFFLVSCLPKRIAYYISKNENSLLTKFIKGLYCIICGIVPGEKEVLE